MQKRRLDRSAFAGAAALWLTAVLSPVLGAAVEHSEAIAVHGSLGDSAAGWEWAEAPARPSNLRGRLAGLTRDGKVLVLGGIDPTESRWGYRYSSRVDIYDPATDEWRSGVDLPAPSEELHVRDSRLIDGGDGNLAAAAFWSYPDDLSRRVDSAARLYLYDEPEWVEAEITPLAHGLFGTARSLPYIVFLSPKTLLAVGGGYSPGLPRFHTVDTVLEFDTVRETWEERSPLTQRREQATGAVLADGRVLVAGGMENDIFEDETYVFAFLTTAEIYDPTTNEWVVASDVPHVMRRASTIRLQDGAILALGGIGSSEVSIYDPSEDEWRPTGTIERNDVAVRLAQTAGGEVLATGVGSGAVLGVFDPSTHMWGSIELPSGMEVAETITEIGHDRYLVTGLGDVSAAILQRVTPQERTIFMPFSVRRR